MIEELKSKAKADMEKVLSSLEVAYQGVRTGRASVNLLDNIKADVYGSLTPIKQLGMVTAPESKTLTIQVYDKSSLKPLEKAIRESSLGLNPVIDGNIIRITLPDLTQDRREELVKHISKITEDSKVSVRNARHDVLKKMTGSEDEEKRFKADVQKLTDQYIEKIDALFSKKKAEIMKV